jgi:predicted lysophospholipase L1 biosynthesis ABC-type transport system permease subunit
MNNTDKVIPRERVALMNAIAERDKTITEQSAKIKRLERQYEIAVERRLRERHERSERRKDMVAAAVLLIAGLCVALPVTLYALTQFWAWANGVV